MSETPRKPRDFPLEGVDWERLAPHLADRLACLGPQRRELLDYLLAEQGVAVPRNRPPVLDHAASSAQEGMWVLHELDPDSAAYTEVLAYRLRGSLGTDELAQSLELLVSRHSVLRAQFATSPAGELRWRAGPAPMPLSAEHLSPAALSDWLEEAVAAPFDLRNGAPLRVRLGRLASDDHVLLLGVHHLVADHGSLNVFVRELNSAYAALLEGAAPALPQLPASYAELSERQRQVRGSGAELRAAWRDHLRGAPRQGPWVRRTGTGRRARRAEFQLPPQPTGALEFLARREGASLFAVLLAALGASLAGETSGHELLVATDVTQRDSLAAERLIGLFVNQVVLRCPAGPVIPLGSNESSARNVLAESVRVANTEVHFALEHAGLPFADLIGFLGRAAPPFQVKLVLQANPMIPLELVGLDVQPIPLPTGEAKFDLLINAWSEGTGLRCVAEASPAVLSQEDLTRLLERFRSKLVEVAGVLDRSVPALRRSPRSPLSGPTALVSVNPPESGGLPRVLRPTTSGVDLIAWAEVSRARVLALLAEHGALLLRGFGAPNPERLQALMRALGDEPAPYTERSSPRRRVVGRIYSSTEHPRDQDIPLHNENAYARAWPRRLYFHCLVAPAQGGRTPLADCRRVLGHLTEADRERFATHGVRYERAFVFGLGLSWQEAFGVKDRAALERRLVELDYGFRWEGEQLRTWWVSPAIRRHPVTGALTWFNHAVFFHHTSLSVPLGSALATVPTTSSYGDGAPFEPELLERVRAAYSAETRSQPWERGDVLVLDNLLVAHGREPFVGSRRILVGLAGASGSRSG